jgi:hypothetical protein
MGAGILAFSTGVRDDKEGVNQLTTKKGEAHSWTQGQKPVLAPHNDG